MGTARRGGRVAVVALGLVAQATFAQDPAGAAPAGHLWAVRVPAVEKVVFRGVVSHDAAGTGTGAMLYPAPNAAGLLVAILTHGLLTENAKASQKQKLQAEADEVLKPYEGLLAGFTNGRLIASALPRLKQPDQWLSIDGSAWPGGHWVVETAPIFSMTADRRALVLDNVVRVYRPGMRDKADYGQTIRVVSAPIALPAAATESSEAVDGLWLSDDGRRLTEETAGLFAESLEVAFAEVTDPSAREPKAPARTFRYPEGGTEKMERAQLIVENCQRTLIRTLRGWLMSIPLSPAAGAVACPAADPAQAAR